MLALLMSALALLLPASALAGAAVDEYSLGPVGGNDAGRADDVQLVPGTGEGKAPQQLGVVGENVSGQSPLEAAGLSAWIGLGVVVLAGVVAIAWRRRPRDGATA